MLDIKYILQNRELIQKSITERHLNVDLKSLIHNFNILKKLNSKVEKYRHKGNLIANQIATIPSINKKRYINRGLTIKNEIKKLEGDIKKVESIYFKILLKIPNIIASDTPTGENDNNNIVIREFMKPKKFRFTPQDHIALSKELDIIDFEAGSKVSGPKFYYLKNEAVLIAMALEQFVIMKATKQGFTLMRPPELVKENIVMSSGYSPRGKESEAYHITGENLYLIATSEIAIGGYHSNQILDEKILPMKYVAYSNCFRTEAGSAGKAGKGLYRVHQFGKVELYVFSKPEESDRILEELLTFEESIYQDLKIPYRVMRICAGDLGAPAYKKYDIETWMPGKGYGGEYGEVTSSSNCRDYQSRRLNIKYKNSLTNNIEYVHTLNGTAIALSRTLISIIENYQTTSGEIIIPKVLRSFMKINKISKYKTYLNSIS